MATHCSGSLQEDLKYHQSTGYDILFECWAVADKLSLQAVAADCEWALARLWNSELVNTRAALDLSPGAPSHRAQPERRYRIRTRSARQSDGECKTGI